MTYLQSERDNNGYGPELVAQYLRLNPQVVGGEQVTLSTEERVWMLVHDLTKTAYEQAHGEAFNLGECIWNNYQVALSVLGLK